jgi:4,5-DOPA dioxygenase extradiol
MTPTADPMPVLYLSHGAPPLADDTRWTAELAAWSAELPRPRNILMVSRTGRSAPIAVSSTSGTTPLVYDFWGFPQKYYEVTYAAPGAPELATSVAGLRRRRRGASTRTPTAASTTAPMCRSSRCSPRPTCPSSRLSMPTFDPQRLYAARPPPRAPARRGHPDRRAPASRPTTCAGSTPRRRGRGTTHPVERVRPLGCRDHGRGRRRQPARLRVAKAPAAHEAHPRTEHWAPLYVALGAADASGHGIEVAQCHRRLLVRPVQAQLAARLSPPSRCTPQLGCGSSAASGTVEP